MPSMARSSVGAVHHPMCHSSYPPCRQFTHVTVLGKCCHVCDTQTTPFCKPITCHSLHPACAVPSQNATRGTVQLLHEMRPPEMNQWHMQLPNQECICTHNVACNCRPLPAAPALIPLSITSTSHHTHSGTANRLLEANPQAAQPSHLEPCRSYRPWAGPVQLVPVAVCC